MVRARINLIHEQFLKPSLNQFLLFFCFFDQFSFLLLQLHFSFQTFFLFFELIIFDFKILFTSSLIYFIDWGPLASKHRSYCTRINLLMLKRWLDLIWKIELKWVWWVLLIILALMVIIIDHVLSIIKRKKLIICISSSLK